MKMKMVALMLAAAAACTLHAGPVAGGLKQTLTGVPAAEVPAKAAELVHAAKAKERPAFTVQAVKAALELNPALAPALVGAVAKRSPEVAAVAAGAAAEQQPKFAVEIARAAAAAAPGQVRKIVSAVCRAVPAQYKRIAAAVAEVAPDESKEILLGIGAGIPELKPAINNAIASTSARPASVSAVLDTPAFANSPGLSSPASVTGGFVRGPTVAPPYVPYSGSTGNVRPSDSGPVPRGDRNYASP